MYNFRYNSKYQNGENIINSLNNDIKIQLKKRSHCSFVNNFFCYRCAAAHYTKVIIIHDLKGDHLGTPCNVQQWLAVLVEAVTLEVCIHQPPLACLVSSSLACLISLSLACLVCASLACLVSSSLACLISSSLAWLVCASQVWLECPSLACFLCQTPACLC